VLYAGEKSDIDVAETAEADLISYFFQEIGVIEWLLIRTHLNVKNPGIII
jgi:hypothetical protein